MSYGEGFCYLYPISTWKKQEKVRLLNPKAPARISS